MSKFLVICFFPAFSPPRSGGELRLLNLYRALAKSHEVTLLTSGDFGTRFEKIQHGEQFHELRFPKDEIWRKAYATLERAGLQGDLSGLAFALAVNDSHCGLRKVARELERDVDYVVHEFPFSEPIFSDGSSSKEIYNSHNFEASLLSSIVGGPGFDAAISKLLRLESNLVARVRRVFATSDIDQEKFRLFYGVDLDRLAVCPNGFEEAEMAAVRARRLEYPRAGRRVRFLFFGSGHKPNVDAARFFAGMAEYLPAFDFIIAGGVTKALAESARADNLALIGSIDDRQKIELFSECDIFLNPVVEGSGTSLKAIEALAAGLGLITTSEGARGLGLRNGQEAVVVSRANFIDAARKLASDTEALDQLVLSARRWATNFAWDHIAAKLASTLSQPKDISAGRRPFILALNDYPVPLVDSGGRARIFNLLVNLDCDALLLTFGETFDVFLIAPHVLHASIPKTPAHQRFEMHVNDGQVATANDCVAALFVGANHVLSQVISLAVDRAHAAIFEHCYMAVALDQILFARPDLPIIFSAHNVESKQKANVLQSHPARRTFAALAGALESELSGRARLTICCTESDAQYFSDFSKEVLVIPNGCVVPKIDLLRVVRERHGQEGIRVGFVGSSHGPNVDAARYIIEHLAPCLQEVQFEFVGSVCAALGEAIPGNVRLHGVLSEDEKFRIQATWTLGINPVIEGGGSSLKLPDYMAHGLPTLSTPAGARGFPVEELDLGTIVALKQFASRLKHIVADRETLQRQGERAYHYAANALDWRVLAGPYRARLAGIIEGRSATSHAGAALLVVTYRYTEPPLGGAEEYLIRVLEYLRPRFARLDLAAIDVAALTNRAHFGTRFEEGGGGANRVGALFDQIAVFAADEVDETEALERSRRLERVWTDEEFQILSAFIPDFLEANKPRLLAGFYGPENHHGVIRRWTAPRFSFLLPVGSAILKLVAYAPIAGDLRIAVGRAGSDAPPQPIFSQNIQSWLSLNIEIPITARSDPLIVVMEVSEHRAVSDHRPLGLLIESVTVLYASKAMPAPPTELSILTEHLIDMTEDAFREVGARFPERWVDTIHEAARQRNDSAEDDFAAVRGPHSRELQAWLAKAAVNYDVVLIQGIPFDVVPRSVTTLAGIISRPRLVVLPHFHGDDRFYHWRRFFEAFAASDATLFFSRSVAERLNAPNNSLVIPGGGVDSYEHGDREAIAAFKAVYQGKGAFFLVLGRKTQSKGYRRIMKAHSLLGDMPNAPELVLIGPDEDGVSLNQKGVHYLSQQPRAVVRGALASCLGVITMSESESFGIVVCEAWLFGKPIIVNANCLAFRELIRDGETGILVRTDSELADAMRRVAIDSDQRRRLAKAGSNELRRSYTWRNVAEKLYGALV